MQTKCSLRTAGNLRNQKPRRGRHYINPKLINNESYTKLLHYEDHLHLLRDHRRVSFREKFEDFLEEEGLVLDEQKKRDR